MTVSSVDAMGARSNWDTRVRKWSYPSRRFAFSESEPRLHTRGIDITGRSGMALPETGPVVTGGGRRLLGFGDRLRRREPGNVFLSSALQRLLRAGSRSGKPR